MKKLILICALCVVLPFSAQANSSAKVDIDVHASTLGFGVGFAFPVTENLAGRLSLSKFNYAFQTTSDNTNYDSTLKLENVAALADWHLFSGITHLTAGLIYNNNGFDMNATPASGGGFTINGNNYPAGAIDSLKANITFNKIAPYLGFGWSGRASKTGFSFKSDIGVMFQGTPKSTLAVTGTAASAAAADVAAAQAKLDSDMENFKLYPVVSVGMAYAF
jgi:hypothetical protein